MRDVLTMGLTGAPGSGKSELANAFADRALDEFGIEFGVFDDTTDFIEYELDRPLGNYGSFVENYWVFFERYHQEQMARKYGSSFISCGTIVDSLAHSGLSVDVLMNGIKTPNTQQRVQVEAMATTLLGFFMHETLRYDYAFYLPLGPQIEVPGAEQETTYAQRIDFFIQAAFQGFGFGFQPLSGTLEEKVEEMIATIKRVEGERESGQMVLDEAEAEAIAEPMTAEEVLEAA